MPRLAPRLTAFCLVLHLGACVLTLSRETGLHDIYHFNGGAIAVRYQETVYRTETGVRAVKVYYFEIDGRRLYCDGSAEDCLRVYHQFATGSGNGEPGLAMPGDYTGPGGDTGTEDTTETDG